MTLRQLGKIEKVDLREIWPNEARAFTPWLAENIAFLGESLGLELELQQREAPVGGYSLDILARDVGQDRPVIIENQLEGTMTAESVARNFGTAADDSPSFEGISVPVKELHNYMREDWNLYGFLYKFPSVSREQALGEIEKTVRRTVKRIIHCDLNGAPVFKRSEAPVKRLFDYLANGRSLKDFHWDFPSVLVEDTWDAVATSGRILEFDAYSGLTNRVVHSDRAYVSGTPIFTGTRLPIRIFFDYLADAQTLKDFHYQYPSAAPDQLVATLGAAWEALEREFHSARRC